MPRSLGTPHQALPSGEAEDYLALWRCNETGADNEDLVDAMGARDLNGTTTAPPRAASPFADAAMAENRGARDFDGSSDYADRSASDGDEVSVQTLVWGVAAAVYIDALGASTFVELGEWDTGAEIAATNTQLSFRMTAAGALVMFWEHTGGVDVTVTTDDDVITAGYHDIGVACEPDPARHNKAQLRFYVDGECVHIEANVEPMTGGSGTSWIIGASKQAGSAVGAPGSFFNGRLDDVVITLWSPSHEWFRWVHARHIRDFSARCDEGGDQEDTTLQYEVHARMLVEVGTTLFTAFDKVNLTDLDLSDIHGIDFLSGLSWGEHVDDMDAGASPDLVPRFGFYDLSPFSEGPLRDLFRERRRVKFETAVVPCGTTRSGVGPHWELVFDGWALSAEVGQTAKPTIAGKGAPLAGAWLEPSPTGGDRQYGGPSPGGSDIETEMQRVIDHADPARFDILLIDDNGAGNTLLIDVHGVSTEHGTGRPHPFTTGDSLKIEGTANYDGVWTVASGGTAYQLKTSEATAGAFAAEDAGTVMGVGLRSYKGGKPTLWVPTISGWNIYDRNEPPAKSVAQLLEDWAGEIGWRCAYRLHEVRQEFRLKFYDPRSAPATVFRTAKMVLPPDRLAVHHEDQRTVGVVVYQSEAARDSANERTRHIVSAKALSELRGDGRYYFQIDTGDQSLINTAAEAQLLVDTVLEDTQDATAEGTLAAPYDPAPQIHDLLELSCDADHAPMGFPVDTGTTIYAAIAGVRHTIAEGKMRTELELRKLGTDSAPTASIARGRRHLEMMTQAGTRPGRGLSGPSTPAAPTVQNLGAINTILSINVSWPLPVADGNQAWDAMEVHVSTTTGFTPSSSTLKTVQRGTSVVVLHGVGLGVTGYVKLVPRDMLGNRGAASAQTAFVA